MKPESTCENAAAQNTIDCDAPGEIDGDAPRDIDDVLPATRAAHE